MAVYRENAKVLVSSASKESTFKTAVAVDRQLIMGRDYVPLVDEAEVYTDDGMGTGSEAPTEVQVARQWSSGALRWDFVRPDDVAFALAYTLGSVTSSATDTSADKHVITPDSSRTLPSFTVEEIGYESYQPKFAGVLITDFALTLEANRPAAMSAGLLVAGNTTSGSATADPVSGEPVMMGSNLKAWLGTAYDGAASLGACDVTATTDDIQAKLRRAEVRISNIRSRDGMFTFASSSISRAERCSREFSVSLTLEVEDATYENYLQAEATKALELDWDSGVLAGAMLQNYGWQMVFPKVFVRAVEKSYDPDGRLLLDVDLAPMEDDDYGVFEAVVYNKQNAYAA